MVVELGFLQVGDRFVYQGSRYVVSGFDGDVVHVLDVEFLGYEREYLFQKSQRVMIRG